MIRIDVHPLKRRFGRTPRRQWQWLVTLSNGRKFSEKDTYANPREIVAIWRKLVASDEPVEVRIHYQRGIDTHVLRGFR